MLIEELIDGTNIESENVEFKGIIREGRSPGCKDQAISWLKTIAAFANTDGGDLYIGVEDKSHKITALDHETADKVTLMLRCNVRERITPRIAFSVNAISVPGTKPVGYVLDVRVEKSAELPVTLHEGGLLGIYIRNFGRTELAAPEQIRELVLTSDNIPYERPFTDRTFDERDFSALIETARRRGEEINAKALISRGFMSEDGRLSKGALLFADDCDDSRTRITATLWPGMTKGSSVVLASRQFQGNLLEGIIFGVDFIKNHSVDGFIKEGAGRSDFFSYPDRSVTEGVVNAVAHRNYYIEGSQIEINIFKDRLEITSPGSLLGVRNLRRETDIASIMPRRRNEVICAVLEMCRYMEQKGSGFDKIAEDYAPYRDRCRPCVSSSSDSFTLVLPDLTFYRNASPAGAGGPADGSGSGHGGPEDQAGGVRGVGYVYVDGAVTGRHDADILSFCYDKPRTVREIAEHIGVRPSTYFRKETVDRLVREGYLKKTAPRDSAMRGFLYLTDHDRVFGY